MPNESLLPYVRSFSRARDSCLSRADMTLAGCESDALGQSEHRWRRFQMTSFGDVLLCCGLIVAVPLAVLCVAKILFDVWNWIDREA